MDTLLDLFSFQGRANRAWYFWHILLDDLAMFTAFIVVAVLIVLTGSPLLILPAIGVGVAGIAITVKRLHDLDRPAWHWWRLLVPIYNIYLGLVLLFKEGTIGPNTYGNDPIIRSWDEPDLLR